MMAPRRPEATAGGAGAKGAGQTQTPPIRPAGRRGTGKGARRGDVSRRADLHTACVPLGGRAGCAGGGGFKMAPCGRVRSRCPGPALLLLLALAARPAAGGGLSPVGPAAGGNPPLAVQAVGPGAPGPRVPRGGGGSGSGWKLSEEAVCREDVVRLCSKHSWANNLAVLECLQDVREVRAGPRGRAYPPRRRRTKSGAPRRPAAAPPALIYLRILVFKSGGCL